MTIKAFLLWRHVELNAQNDIIVTLRLIIYKFGNVEQSPYKKENMNEWLWTIESG